MNHCKECVIYFPEMISSFQFTRQHTYLRRSVSHHISLNFVNSQPVTKMLADNCRKMEKGQNQGLHPFLYFH